MPENHTNHDPGSLLAAIINSSDDAIISKNLNGVITSWNKSAERIFGYTAKEAVGQPVSILFPPDRLDEEPRILESLRRGERVDHFQTIRRRKDGKFLNISVTISPVKDAAGKIIGASKIARDITPQLELQAKLRRSDERFGIALASVGDAVIATDKDGRVSFMNAVAERLTGWSISEATTRPLPEVFHIVNEYTREAVKNPVLMVLETGDIVGLANHTILIAKDGTERPIDDSGAPIREVNGEISGVVLVFRDVTERRTAELIALRFAAIIHGSEDAIIGKDLSGIITSWNEGARRIFGYSSDEIIGQSILKLIPKDLQDEEKTILARLRQGERIEHFETNRLTKEGQTIQVSLSVSPIKDADGRIIGASKIARDITERKRVQLALEEAQQSAKAALVASRVKSEFLANMSHELRTPLNAILGFAQLMESDDPPPTACQAKCVEQILESGWYLLNLINEVLDLAAVESGKLAISMESVSLSEIFSNCQQMMEPEAQKRHIRMIFPILDQPVFVVADRTRLKQILVNLLSNALKYNSAGGSVRVELTQSRPGCMRISVKDSGAGLDPDKIGQLFTPFNRLGQEKSNNAGTGIGLVMSKRLAELMNGTVGVESVVGEGSTFWCELASASAPHNPPPSERPDTVGVANSAQGNRKVLYVEDNPANLRLVEEIVKRLPNVKLFTATDASLGIDLAHSAQPDVILMDINLSGISGLEALKILRDDPATTQIPVVALSAHAVPRDIQEGLEAGFFNYLTKPIKIKEVVATLSAAFDQKKSNTRL